MAQDHTVVQTLTATLERMRDDMARMTLVFDAGHFTDRLWTEVHLCRSLLDEFYAKLKAYETAGLRAVLGRAWMVAAEEKELASWRAQRSERRTALHDLLLSQHGPAVSRAICIVWHAVWLRCVFGGWEQKSRATVAGRREEGQCAAARRAKDQAREDEELEEVREEKVLHRHVKALHAHADTGNTYVPRTLPPTPAIPYWHRIHAHEHQEKKDPQLHVFVHLHVEEETNTKHLLPTTYPREPAERLAQRGTSMQEHKHEEAQPCPRDLPSDGARARGDGAVLAHVHVGRRTTRNIRPPTYAPARFPSSLIVGYPRPHRGGGEQQATLAHYPSTHLRPPCALCTSASPAARKGLAAGAVPSRGWARAVLASSPSTAWHDGARDMVRAAGMSNSPSSRSSRAPYIPARNTQAPLARSTRVSYRPIRRNSGLWCGVVVARCGMNERPGAAGGGAEHSYRRERGEHHLAIHAKEAEEVVGRSGAGRGGAIKPYPTRRGNTAVCAFFSGWIQT
ncbi:hypothetical protein C8J57DRAFT_1640115 [Mycena rebaudengoi]|nr:hypothetical protein C8J57DRAFT_1640115 [Mycena rebaudengoi]